jgi:hypothetical protein
MSRELFRTPRIACLGWGSLIWDPRALPIQREWFKDGPLAPVEFSRQSSDGRITLVIDPRAEPTRLLWARMNPVGLPVAREALGERESIPRGHRLLRIGTWQAGDTAPVDIPDLPKWAEAHGLDAAVWTALGPRFRREERPPSIDEVIEYLRELGGPVREHARRYIQRTPRQIDTAYRRGIEAVLGWSCTDDS